MYHSDLCLCPHVAFSFLHLLSSHKDTSYPGIRVHPTELRPLLNRFVSAVIPFPNKVILSSQEGQSFLGHYNPLPSGPLAPQNSGPSHVQNALGYQHP